MNVKELMQIFWNDSEAYEGKRITMTSTAIDADDLFWWKVTKEQIQIKRKKEKISK